MGRWEPNAHGRLEQAAMELYLDRGYDDTTVALIAERAGLTERTFFRYFADKREVLFAGATGLQALLVEAVAAAAPSLPPLAAVAAALDEAGGLFEQNRERARQRQSVIDANPTLQERELTKMAALASALADTLREQGVRESAAGLAAQAGIAVFRLAFERWVVPAEERGLRELLTESFDELRVVTAAR